MDDTQHRHPIEIALGYPHTRKLRGSDLDECSDVQAPILAEDPMLEVPADRVRMTKIGSAAKAGADIMADRSNPSPERVLSGPSPAAHFSGQPWTTHIHDILNTTLELSTGTHTRVNLGQVWLRSAHVFSASGPGWPNPGPLFVDPRPALFEFDQCRAKVAPNRAKFGRAGANVCRFLGRFGDSSNNQSRWCETWPSLRKWRPNSGRI